jgi:hypothetical protein
MTTTESSAPLTGGCLCGAVRFEARPNDRNGYYCHCRMCQLAFGNTRATFFNLPKDRVRWTAAEPTWYTSSKIAVRGFCGRCGTPLTFAFNHSKNMDLSVGSLDDPSAVKPTSHSAVESRIAAWHVPDGLPEDRLDTDATLNGLWKKAYGDDVEPGIGAVRAAP